MKLCDINEKAAEMLPPEFMDKSGAGVHYADAYIKPMNITLEDGSKILVKRRGLKITIKWGEKKGEGLLRRLDVGPDPTVMLQTALKEAADQAGLAYKAEGGALFLD